MKKKMKIFLALLFSTLFIMGVQSQDFTSINDLANWGLNGGWTNVNNTLLYNTNINNVALGPLISVSPGNKYRLSITYTVPNGSGVLEIGFGNDETDFRAFVLKQLAQNPPLANDGDNDADDNLSVITYNVEFEFDEAATTRLIFRVQSVSVQLSISQINASDFTLIPPAQQMCESYLGFGQFEITRLLACRTATKLDGYVDDVLQRLARLKTKVLAGDKLTEVVDYSQWIEILNAFNEGSACSINFRDFDLYVWLVNHQINYALNRYHGEQLVKKMERNPFFGRTFLKAPKFKRSLIDFEPDNIY